jgi:hypothetical protein
MAQRVDDRLAVGFGQSTERRVDRVGIDGPAIGPLLRRGMTSVAGGIEPPGGITTMSSNMPSPG